MTRPTRTEIEEIALNNATPIFQEIYGNFEWITGITDSPDAAIKAEDGKLIGIEIIQIDNEDFLKRSNTWQKLTKAQEEISEIKTRLHIIPEDMGKRICIKKNLKLYKYKKLRNFHLYALLIVTENLQLRDNEISNYYYEHLLYALEGSLIRNRLNYDRSFITNKYSGDTKALTIGKTKTRTRPENFNVSDWKKGNHYIDRADVKFIAARPLSIEINFNGSAILKA